MLRFKKLLAVVAVASMLCSALAVQVPAAQAKAPAKKIVHLNNSEEPGTLHPSLAQGTHESWIIGYCFEGLFIKGEDGSIKNGMAESYKTSADGLTWTFTLRPSKWSNGDPVTARDFETSWKYCMNPKTAAKYSGQMAVIKGAKEYTASKETDVNKLKALEAAVGVKALDEKTLEVKLVNPIPYLTDYLTHYTFDPVDSNIQLANPNWAQKPSTFVSNGPFKLTEWKNKELIQVVKNPNYYDAAKIKLDGIDFTINSDNNTTYQMYQAGELDLCYPLVPAVVEKAINDKNPELIVAPELSSYFYYFNLQKKPFNNVKVRKALAMTIDRNAIVKSVTKGGQLPAYALTPPGISNGTGDYQKDLGPLFKEDVAEAKKLLAEGLKEEGMSKLSFSLIYNTNETHKRICEAAQNMWKTNLGIDVKLEVLEFQVLLDRRKAGDFEVARAGWVGDYADPMTFLDMWVTGGEFNDGKWSNAEYDKLIQSARTLQDPKARTEAFKSAEKLLIDNMVILPFYFYTKAYLTKPYLKGVYTPVNRYPDVRYADIVK